MNPQLLRYRLSNNFAFSKVRLVIGQTSVQANVAPHPLFNQVKEIYLINDQINLKCLELLRDREISIPSDKSTDFVNRCKDILGSSPQLIIEQMGINLLLGKSQQDFQTLDHLCLSDLLSVIKSAFDKTGVKLHSKIMRRLKSYSTGSKRKQSQKQTIQNIIRLFKDDKQLQQVQVQNDNEVEPQTEPKNIKQKSKKQVNTKEKKIANAKQQSPYQSQPRPKYQQQLITKVKSQHVTSSKAKNRQQQEQQEDQIQEVNKLQVRNTKKYGKNRRNRRRQQSESNEYEDKLKQKGFQRRKGNSPWEDRGSSRGKGEVVDPKILLGLTGDTQFGWRQRHRPTRIPPKSANQQDQRPKKEKKKQNFQNLKQTKRVEQNQLTSQNQNKAEIKAKTQTPTPKKTQVQPQPQVQTQTQTQEITKTQGKVLNKVETTKVAQVTKQLQDGSRLLFSYPKDGKSYNFNNIKNQFKIFVNESFWVNFKNGVLTIQKGQDGFVRDSQIDAFQNKLMAEGLTLNLEGSSNLQDGGDSIGNPAIQQFTGNNSQFFHIKTLNIYSSQGSQGITEKRIEKSKKSEQKQKNKKPKYQKKQKPVQQKNQQLKLQKGQQNQNDWQDQDELDEQQTEKITQN